MPILKVNNVNVEFPFEPYEIQKDYMSKVIQCLDEKKNGLLESPTGTGKTLSLLCSSLAWVTAKKIQHNLERMSPTQEEDIFLQFPQTGENEKIFGRQNVPKILYSSRTHSQLSQVIREFKRSGYSQIRSSVIGSRDHMCINPSVTSLESSLSKRYMCESLVKSRSCTFYHNVEIKKNNPILTENILDIEDLVTAGKKLKCCPYYMAKELCTKSDIIFMPYNYIVEAKRAPKEFFTLKDNIVIIDEAHNIDKICEETASTSFSSTDIAMCIEEITAAMKRIEDDLTSDGLKKMEFSPENLVEVKQVLLDLEQAFVEIQCSKEGTAYSSSKILEVFEKAKINDINVSRFIDILNRIGLFLCSDSSSPFTRSGANLNKFENFLNTIEQSKKHKDKSLKCYKLFVENLEIKNNPTNRLDSWVSITETKIKPKGKNLNYWCFSPSFGIQQLIANGVHCIILTSGTLAPLPPLISELGVPFPITLENPHIIQNNQILVSILTNGPDKIELNSSYQNRSNTKYIFSLGVTLTNLARTIPHGMLIFFPSYTVMNSLVENWKISGIYENLNSMKPIFIEGKNHNFVSTIHEYYEKINDDVHKGACFMAVLRGKVSEGLDFADNNGRAVVIIGIPYPPIKDPKIQLKQKYLEEIKQQGESTISGRDWYQLEATRAVNQAVGRVIRHSKDYGAIIFCDKRFAQDYVKSHLSKWLRNRIKVDDNFGPLIRNLRQFFQYTNTNLPVIKKEFTVQHEVVKQEKVEEVPQIQDSKISELYMEASGSTPVQTKKLGLFDFSTKQIEDMKSPIVSHKPSFLSFFSQNRKTEDTQPIALQNKKRKFNVTPLKKYEEADE